MFDQPGKKIKDNASGTFWVIAALVGVRLLLIAIEAVQGEGDASALLWDALVCFAVLLSTYLIMLVLYVVGDMAEETARQTKLFEQNNELLRQLLERTVGAPSNTPAPASEPETVPAPEPETAPTPDPAPAPTPAPVVITAQTITAQTPRSHTTVRCPECGTPQGDAREKCYNCGAPLKRE